MRYMCISPWNLVVVENQDSLVFILSTELLALRKSILILIIVWLNSWRCIWYTEIFPLCLVLLQAAAVNSPLSFYACRKQDKRLWRLGQERKVLPFQDPFLMPVSMLSLFHTEFLVEKEGRIPLSVYKPPPETVLPLCLHWVSPFGENSGCLF